MINISQYAQKILETDLTRFDQWIEKSDQKASYILALVTLMLIAVVFQSGTMFEENECGIIRTLKRVLIGLELIFLVGGGYFSIKVLKPEIKENSVYLSCLYFNDVKNIGVNELKAKLSTISEKEYIDDMTKQIKELARICATKMKNVERAIHAIIWAGVIFLVLGVVVIIT